jgi:hypothetical protein
MSPVWSVPYFSGAANLEAGRGWYFLPSEVDSLKEARGWSFYTYSFKKGGQGDLQSYSQNVPGYLYWVYMAHKLIPFFNEVFSIVCLQAFLHAMVCFLSIRMLESRLARLIFMLFYAINPLVLYFVTFPFYYFFQSISAFLLVLFFFGKRPIVAVRIALIALGILAFLTRKTVLPMGLMLSGVLFFQKRFALASLNLAAMVLVPLLLQYVGLSPKKSPGLWHTAFIGIGAYPNPYPGLQQLSDNCGTSLYKKERDPSFSLEISGSFVKNTEVMDSYFAFMKENYFRVLNEKPLLLARNAALNFFQAYSLGHLSNKPFIFNLLIAISGLCYFFLLVKERAWFFLISIGMSHLAFTPYFPPIPAYMFGSYILLVFGFCKVFIENSSSRGQEISVKNSCL